MIMIIIILLNNHFESPFAWKRKPIVGHTTVALGLLFEKTRSKYEKQN